LAGFKDVLRGFRNFLEDFGRFWRFLRGFWEYGVGNYIGFYIFRYINEDISEEKLSNIVSGALDRLHYEDDPSVKYYSDKKIWIYLHKDRFF
jgi:hypothetical protein